MQALIREFAGTVDESTDELAKIKAAMKAKAAVAVAESPPVEPVQPTPAPPPARPVPAAAERHYLLHPVWFQAAIGWLGLRELQEECHKAVSGLRFVHSNQLEVLPGLRRVLPMIRT